MGKLSSTSPPPIEKRGSSGSCGRRPLVTPPLQPDFPTTYREEGFVGKLPPNFPTTYTEEGLVGKLIQVRRLSPLCHGAALARRRRGRLSRPQARVRLPVGPAPPPPHRPLRARDGAP